MIKTLLILIVATSAGWAGTTHDGSHAATESQISPQVPCPQAQRGFETMISLIDKWQANPEFEGLRELLQMELKELKQHCPESEVHNAQLYRFIAPLEGMVKEMSDPASAESMSKAQMHLLSYYEEFFD